MRSLAASTAEAIGGAHSDDSELQAREMAPPLSALRMAAPAGACFQEEPANDGEKVALLAPLPETAAWLSRLDVESGGAAPAARSHDWEVVVPLDALCCGVRRHRAVEIVALRRANYGLRWTAASAKQDHRNGARDDKPRPSTPFCIVGPHWWLMAATFTVFLVAALVVTALTLPQAGRGEAVMGVLLSAACLSMYAKVACSNPGIVEPLDEPLDENYTYCGECESYRPPEAMHCMDCRVCIEGYDHHCPWTGKCIGKRNVRYFYAWLFFLVLAFVYEMIEFTTYMLPPEGQPRPFEFELDDDDSFAAVDSTAPTRPALRQP